MQTRIEIKRYTFINFSTQYFLHHIDTSMTLDNFQQNSLREILAVFPHGTHCNDWIIRFPKTDFSSYDKELLALAANAHDGENPVLHTACDNNGPVQIIQALIDFGANLNASDKKSRLAMHRAISTNMVLTLDKNSSAGFFALRCLLVNGARADIACYAGKNPLEYALNQGYMAQATLIKPFANRQQNCFAEESIAAFFQHGIKADNCKEISRHLFWKDIKNLAQTSKTTWEHVSKKMDNLRQSFREENSEEAVTESYASTSS